MAIDDGPSFAGRRLAEIRSSRKLTAAELAEAVPGDLVSKTVITNLESGRKRDMTLTEAVALAWALDVPVLSFFLGSGGPWDRVAFTPIDATFSEMTNIEYARRSSMYPGGGTQFSSRWWAQAHLLDHLIKAERLVIQLDLQADLDEDDDRTIAVKDHDGEQFLITAVPSYQVWETLKQPIIDHYRECLEGVRLTTRFAGAGPLPPKFSDRIEALRQRVVQLLAEDPTLDFGQDDRVGSGPPRLNPATGRPRVLEGTDGPPTDPAE